MTMIFEKLARKRLSEEVADHIEEAILDGKFVIGSQLPSEQQLADNFGVSRNVVREAFKFLKARGLIEIRNGSGAYVCQLTGEPTSSALGRYIRMLGAHQSVEMLYEVRRLIEGENVRLAALRATDEDLAVIHECLTRMRKHTASLEKWAQADLDFHLALARAAHNPFLSILLEPLMGQLRDVIIEGFVIPGAVERGLRAHEQIYACIVAHDAEGASAAIIEHLHDSEARVERIYTQRENQESRS